MPDTKITALAAITTVAPANDLFAIVDVSDNSMAASGTTKNITTNQILGAGGTATLASATITGALTVGTATALATGSGRGNVTVNGSTDAILAFGIGGVNSGFVLQDSAGMTLLSSGATYLRCYTNGSERYKIDSTGVATWSNVGGGSGTAMTLNATGLGIGMSPSAILSALKSSATQATGLILRNDNGTDGGSISLDFETSAGASGSEGSLAGRISGRRVGSGTTGALDFFVNNAGTLGTAKMTLDASGNLLVGKTASSTTVAGSQVQPDGTFSAVKGDTNPAFFYNRSTAASGTIALFRSNGVTVGTITQDGTNTAYVTSSDYRLKESVAPLNGGLARVNALKPSIYKWKSNGSDGEGFLAHELAEVVPAAVVGSKDAVNEDGTINPQGIDLSKIVPILVAAIQELTARVQTLEAK